MKLIASKVVILAATLICSGCVCTNKVAQKADQHPAYALLFPLALPADIIVTPAVGLMYVHAMSGPQGDGSGSH